MSSHPSRTLVLAVASLLVLVGCTGEDADPSSTGPSVTATPPASSTSAPTTTETTPTPPPPSPTPPPVVAGAGEVVVTADDGTFVRSQVAGTCLLAGSDLPAAGVGPARGDDVETFVAVDNYLGPLGEPVAPADLAITIDGTDGAAQVELFGGPVPWSWWAGEVGAAVLSDPVDDDGVTVSTLSMTATLPRAPRTQTSVRAPRPPLPSPSPTAVPPTPSPSGNPAGAAPVGIAPPPRPDPPADVVRQPASPSPDSPSPTTSPSVAPSNPTPSPPGWPSPPGPTPDGVASPSPTPTATPVAALTIELEMTCTLVAATG